MSDAASLTASSTTDCASALPAAAALELPVSIVIAVPTFRRPQSLQYLLQALEALDTDANVTVLVADNDGEKREGFDLCAALRNTGYRWLLDSIVVPERGIAQVRNALVARILVRHPCDFVAMMDDDEWPAPHWLDEFLRVQRQTGADALQGTIKRVFETDPGRWTVYCDGVSDAVAPTGSIAMLQGAGNLLVRRDCFEKLPTPWFDPAFAFTGGEDADFLIRIKAQGARFAWAHEALAYDRVPPSRANLAWALKRAYSTGNSDMRVFLKHNPGFGARMNQAVRIVGALLLNPLLFAILMIDPNRRVKPLRKICRAAGKIAAIGGRHYDEYSVIHGH